MASRDSVALLDWMAVPSPSVSIPRVRSSFSGGGSGWRGSSGGSGWRDSSGSSGFSAQAPAVFPEKIQFQMPFSSSGSVQPTYQSPPAAAPQEDWDWLPLGSLQRAVGDAIAGGRNMNPASVMARILEAPGVIAKNLASGILGDDHPLAQAIGAPFDIYNEAMTRFSDITAPLLDALPNWYRDSQLGDRAKVYRAMAAGTPLDTGPLGLGEFLMTGEFLNTGPGASARDMAHAWNNVAAIVSPDARKQRDFLMDAMDLPTSVKDAIRRNANLSDDALEKLLDEAPEGRQWTYAEGLQGIARSLIAPAIIYGGEAIAGYRWAGWAGRQAGLAGAPTAFPKGIPLIGGRGPMSAAGRIQTALAGTGAASLALTTVGDSIARTQGNQALLDFSNTVFNEHPISDNPHVQLITSFTVNPFAAVGLAKRGTIRFAYGAGDITLGKALGTRYARIVTQDDVLYGALGKMYGVTPETAKGWVGKYFSGRGAAADHLAEQASDEVMHRLPKEEQAAIQAAFPDPIARAKHVLKEFAEPVMDTIEKHPVRLAAKMQEAWAYHDLPGPFDPEKMLGVYVDNSGFKAATYRARQAMGAVAGYPDVLHPTAAADVRASLEKFGADEVVPVEWRQDYQISFPALNRYIGQTRFPKGATRADIEQALAQADTDFRSAAHANPVRAQTGSDPVLRPNATTAEWAAALGTTDDVIEAMGQGVAGAEKLRPFLVQRAGLDEAVVAAMTPDDVAIRAAAFMDESSKPWVDAGKVLASSEAELATLQAEYRALQLADEGYRNAKGEITGGTPVGARARDIEKRVAELQELLSTAQDPLVPFSAQVAHARREVRLSRPERAAAEAAQRRVAAWAALGELDAQVESLQPVADALFTTPRDVLANVVRDTEGRWRYVPSTVGPMPGPIAAAYESYLRRGVMPKRNIAESFRESPDPSKWADVAHSKGFQKDLAERPGHVVSVGDATMTNREILAEITGLPKRMRETGVGLPMNPAAVKALGAETEEAAVESLGLLRSRRDAILDGQTPYSLRRTAGKVVTAEEEALAASVDQMLVRDPIFEVIDHPRNLGQLKAAIAAHDAATAESIIARDPLLRADAGRLGIDKGADVERLSELIPPDFDPARPPIRTPLDQAVLGGDHAEVAKLVDELGLAQGRLEPHPPVKGVTPEAAAKVLGGRVARPSTKYLRQLDANGVEGTTLLDPAVMLASESRVGRDVLSILNRNFSGPGTEPHTVGTLVSLLREIENGNATNMGIGPELQAEAQKLANRLIEHTIKQGKRAGFAPGLFHPSVDPRLLPDDEVRAMHDLLDRGDILMDPTDPVGFQYGFKRSPKDAVTWEFEEARRIADETGVPGLGEEFLSERFMPYTGRIAGAKIRQAFNFVFGERGNIDIAIASEADFIARLTRLGVAVEDSTAVWKGWRQQALDSRSDHVRRFLNKLGGKEVKSEKGDNPLYASPRNIPNGALQETAEQVLLTRYPKGGMPGHYREVDWSHTFRQSSSRVLRTLEDSPHTLGQLLGATYGLATTNKAVTTLYPLFRFGLDIRFHAMNLLEPHFLGAGRAGLLPDVDDLTPNLGYSEEYLRNLSRDALIDTGYPFSMARAKHAYYTFRKEQSRALLDRIKGIGAEDPVLMEKALLELADPKLHLDAELPLTIRMMGDTPQKWLKALDEDHGNLLNAANTDEVFDTAFAAATRETPALAEVYGQLAVVNKQLWTDVRGTMFGNPSRSRLERVLNSYLLYWPISYQIKSTKWLMRVLYDRAGGIKTNAGGAFMLDQVMELHNEHLRDDPEYARWFEEHPTLVFAAQMLVPISWDSMGISLSPPLRDLFFGRSKAIGSIGPVYTITDFLPKLVGELYDVVSDLPGMDWAVRMTGKPAEGGAPIEEFIGDTLRFGQ